MRMEYRLFPGARRSLAHTRARGVLAIAGVGVGARTNVCRACATAPSAPKSQTDLDLRQGRAPERWVSLAGIRMRGRGKGWGGPSSTRETPRSAQAVGV
jgi:hypothetical protein